jgi:hypothetical protein
MRDLSASLSRSTPILAIFRFVGSIFLPFVMYTQISENLRPHLHVVFLNLIGLISVN